MANRTDESPDPISEFEGIDAALAAIDDAIDLDQDEVTFDAPWQARAFGIAVALQSAGDRDWEAFQERFVEQLRKTEPDAMQENVEGVYYQRWLEGLERLLLEEGMLTEAELEARTAAFTEGERDAAEFVVDASETQTEE